MSSFKAIRELTLLSYAENLLYDDEFLVLWEGNQSKNPDFPWDRYSPFDLENMDEAECKAEFRVQKRDLHTLGEVLETQQLLGARKGVYAKAWKDFVC